MEDYIFNDFSEIVEKEYNRRLDSATTKEEKDTIIQAFNSMDLSGPLMDLIDLTTEQAVKDIVNARFEISLNYRAEEDRFLANQLHKWNRGFTASEMLLSISLDFIDDLREYVDDLPDEDKNQAFHVYIAMTYLFSRASQQYLEVLSLCKGGLADGAMARWRSLYELAIITSFITENGEETAKAFIDAAYSLDHYDWAKASGQFSKKGRLVLGDIEKKCTFDTVSFTEPYNTACLAVHPSAQGTFRRIGLYDNSVIPTGRTDFGIDYPAKLAAITFSQIVIMFLSVYTSATNTCMIKTIADLIPFVIDEYKWCFDNIIWDDMENNSETTTENGV